VHENANIPDYFTAVVEAEDIHSAAEAVNSQAGEEGSYSRLAEEGGPQNNPYRIQDREALPKTEACRRMPSIQAPTLVVGALKTQGELANTQVVEVAAELVRLPTELLSSPS
jgi:hypothetical protein